MKACFLIKYPPIQGGVSRGGYWMARDLAERGHQIFVVTNANEVEDDYRIYMNEEDREWYEPRFEQSGGLVKVRHTQPLSKDFTHIPQSNPFVSKLASAATQVIRSQGCEVIFAYYLEPYGMAAYLASMWTGVPFMVRHAGSDLGRLMKQRDLTTAYREIFKAADGIWTGLGTRKPFLAMGVKEENLFVSRAAPVRRQFNPQTPALDLNSLLTKFAALRSPHVQNVLTNNAALDLSKPTIGIYGKVGEVKGSYDLLSALGELKRGGYDFNFVALTQGLDFSNFKNAILQHDLQDKTWTFPFIPHWRVPGFIRACDAVCFLERDFPITFHGPGVAKEVLATGTCLILSREIAEKQQTMKGKFEHGENILIVEDPKDHAELAENIRFVFEHRDQATAIGLEGRKLLQRPGGKIDGGSAADKNTVEAFEGQLLKLINRPRHQAIARGEQAATSDATRKERLKSALVATNALLNGNWEQLVDRFCQGHDANAGNRFADAVEFCEFVEANYQGTNGNGYLKDVLKFEKFSNLMYTDGNAAAARRQALETTPLMVAFGESVPPAMRKTRFAFTLRADDERVSNFVPVKARGLQVVEFNHDLDALFAMLDKGEIPESLPEVKQYILFKKELNFVNLEMEISEPVKQLLELCDGERTVAAIIAELRPSLTAGGAPDTGEDAFKHEVFALLQELFLKGVIRFA